MTHSPTQQERQLAVSVPHLGEDVLLLRHMTAREELGRLFEYELELLSEDHDIDLQDVLGRNVTISLELLDGGTRYFNGHVRRFTYGGTHGEYARYLATVRPWLWFLTLRADCRIYQNVTVPDIIRETFRRHGFADFEDRLVAEYRAWEYSVQYRETDFAFVSRLMEQEGIYYYFQHEDGKHTLVLCDGPSAHRPMPGYEQVRFLRRGELTESYEEHVFDWSVSHQVEPAGVGLKDFDFQDPRISLDTKVTALSELQPEGVPSRSELEIYDYPGEYERPDQGEAYARLRMEELEAQYELAEGHGNARGLAVGSLFSLSGHPRSEENAEYLIVAATYQLHSDAYEPTPVPEPEPTFRCGFRALDSGRRYRSPRTTPLPVVQGPQTAIVVGPQGEKVWPDKFGRVKAQFHWDRYGQRDENSSCWIRVSQSWAGKGWGGMSIPHIGQEVVVEFLEGDPDRPLITGRVYNADNMPPLELPDHKHRSVMRDDYGNEIVFDATPGKEHLWLHSPHHQSSLALGRSLQFSTESDQNSVVVGLKNDIVGGAFYEAVAGQKTEVLVGSGTTMRLGPLFEAALGWSTSVNLNHDLHISFADEVSLDTDDYHKQIGDCGLIDSENILQLVAGENRNSLVRMDGESVDVMCIPDTPRRSKRRLQVLKYFLTTYAVLAALAAVGQGAGVGILAGVERFTSKKSADANGGGTNKQRANASQGSSPPAGDGDGSKFQWNLKDWISTGVGSGLLLGNILAGVLHIIARVKRDVEDVAAETDDVEPLSTLALTTKGDAALHGNNHVVLLGKKVVIGKPGEGNPQAFVFCPVEKRFKAKGSIDLGQNGELQIV